MSTTPGALYPNYYQPYYQQAGANNVGYQTGNNPVAATQNQRAVTESQGDQYQLSDEELAQQQQQAQQGTQNYLDPLEEANASGQGGYTADQASQIELTPQQQQDIVTGAGISAGAGTASSVGAAERAANAAGGNPAALATYRARAAQTQGADAGQAETGARVAAQQAGSAGAQAVGNAQIAEENQGQNYFGNLQAQEGAAQQTQEGLAQGAYGTETSGTGAATNSEISAAGIPTGTDKLIGAVAGAASSLADGYPGYMDDGGQDAVVGENGMEAVIENAPKAVVKGASDPVRSNTRFMDTGGVVPGSPTVAPPSVTGSATPPTSSGMPSWLQSYLANSGKPTPGTQAPAPGQPGWNKTTPYSQLGAAVGGIAKKVMQGGGGSPSGGGFAPGSSQMPSGSSSSGGPGFGVGSGSPANAAATMPGGLINRTGSAIDGTPSLPIGGASDTAGGVADYLGGGAADLGEGAADVAAPAADAIGSFAADGRPMLADGSPPEAEEYASDPENSNPVTRYIDDQALSVGSPSMMANGKMGGGFHWSDPAPRMPVTPRMQERSGYQPLGYKAKPMLADGAMPMDGDSAGQPSQSVQPVQPGNGMQVGNAKVFNKPTMIHLEKADMVVPLGYRAKAKVRPSAALPALKAAPRRLYGAHAA